MQKHLKWLQARLRQLTWWQAGLVLLVVGLITFSSGLGNAFQGDDSEQIVNSIPAHSIRNLNVFFTSGTFFDGNVHHLIGSYYRPLMTTTFAAIYSAFGPHPFYFHLVQLLLGIGSGLFLYLFFRYLFQPALALTLALLFLVHPLDSQVMYFIPTMQDALFFFFGILGFYLLVRFKSYKGLLPVVACFFLSLLAKETGIFFAASALLYLYWWDRRRLLAFSALMLTPIALWLMLKINAVGLNHKPTNAPIDRLGLAGRLMTAPEIVLLYIIKLVFPWQLASVYWWVNPTFSVRHVLLPLIIDLAVVAGFVYAGRLIYQKAVRSLYYAYLLFATWLLLGLGAHLQVIPLDFTAAEPWFYFSMAGLLGMIGIIWMTLVPRKVIKWRYLPAVVLLLLVGLGVRSFVRGFDWKDEYTMALSDTHTSRDDFSAQYQIALHYYNLGDYQTALSYAQTSVNMFSNASNQAILGGTLSMMGNYDAGYAAYQKGLSYEPNFYSIIDGLAGLTLYHGDPISNEQFMIEKLQTLQTDSSLWFYLALLEARYNNYPLAKQAISNAAQFGQVDPAVYNAIQQEQPFKYRLGNNPPVLVDGHTWAASQAKS